MSAKYIALIPAYEPLPLLTDLTKEAQEAGFEVIVVDDGGGPRFAHIFESASQYAHILTHEVNRGKGRAMKTGMEYIRDNYPADSIIVTVDADGQHRISDAWKLCEMAQAEPGALMLGSRKFTGNVPLRSRFGNSVTRAVYRISTGLAVRDTQTGLRAFSMALLPDLLEIPGDRYEYEMNVLLEFARRRTPIREMDIPTIYIDDNSSSHFNTLKDSVRIYKEILKFSASSFAGFIVDYILYSLLIFITGNLRASNIAARIVSATVNFSLNRRFVFKSRENLLKSAVKYAALAIIILIGNTLVLEFLAGKLGLHGMVAKLITEIFFFLLSWTAQHFLVFKKK